MFRYILGEWDINALLLPILKKSENKKAKEFIKRAEKNQGIEFFDFKRKDLPLEQLGEELNFYEDSDEQYWNEINSNAMEIDSNIPPLYQTYIVEKLEMKLPHQQSTKYEIRAQKSREIRKKMVAAMLCLCKEYKVKQIPYAGYYMIMNMSDQSIRDFLRQMHEIYIFENKSAEKFIKSRINIKTQNIAIHQASENRFRGIRNETTYYLSEVVSLINSLGQITAKIQSSCPSSLKTPEKGRFLVDFDLMKSEDERKTLREILLMARNSYLIKIYDFSNISKDNRILFSPHKLFAPKFGFSYRGAYFNISISGERLLKLCKEEDEKEYKKNIDKIVSEIIKDDNTVSLDKWIK